MLINANSQGAGLAENWVSFVKERGGKKLKGWKGGNEFLTVMLLMPVNSTSK